MNCCRIIPVDRIAMSSDETVDNFSDMFAPDLLRSSNVFEVLFELPSFISSLEKSSLAIEDDDISPGFPFSFSKL